MILIKKKWNRFLNRQNSILKIVLLSLKEKEKWLLISKVKKKDSQGKLMKNYTTILLITRQVFTKNYVMWVYARENGLKQQVMPKSMKNSRRIIRCKRKTTSIRRFTTIFWPTRWKLLASLTVLVIHYKLLISLLMH